MSIEHWIWLSELDAERKDKTWLAETFGDAEQVYTATNAEFQAAGVSASFSRFLSNARTLAQAAKIAAYCRRHNIAMISLDSKEYPERLKNIDVPPLVLYALGKMPDFDRLPTVGIVGSRNVGDGERRQARDFAFGLAKSGMMVVSGMALGIDGMANMGAMDAGMSTAAVLGSGVDVCYPAQNRTIYERILSTGGCILSEYPPGSRPNAEHFPERNRIISGLAMGVVILAAPARSGALITANCALEQGRDIFVVPGGIDNPHFVGSNRLIKDGAVPVTEPADVITEYRGRYPELFDDEPEHTAYVPQKRMRTAEVISARRDPAAGTLSVEKHAASYVGPQDYDLSAIHENKPLRKMVRIDDLLRKFPYRVSERKEISKPKEPSPEKRENPADALDGQERSVYEAIQNGCELADDIIDRTGIPAGEIIVTLSILTVKGFIEEQPGRRFRIKE